MIHVKSITFNPFQENTYIIWEEGHEACLIFDPGNGSSAEDRELLDFLTSNHLTPVRLINTHCHIDHVLGNQLIADKYGLELEAHRNEQMLLQNCEAIGKMYGIPFQGSPSISKFLKEGEHITLGDLSFQIIFTPGHSPGSLSFFETNENILISGDVLFYGSIGRTDLPGGDHRTLITSIVEKLLVLPDAVTVYPGHGPVTTIGFERQHNPFLQD